MALSTGQERGSKEGSNYHDIAVIGAGPAGIMAAIRASQLKRYVALIERNDSIGKKILLTGKGRCNITNAAPLDVFIKKFGREGNFLRTAFSSFSNDDLMDFFKSNGLELKIERQARVFPSTDSASSVVKVLERLLAENRVKVLYNMRVKEIKKEGSSFNLDFENGANVKVKKVILATGGASYKATGSSGDGFRIAKKLGHTVQNLSAGLVPLKAKEAWVNELQGLSLENISISFVNGKKKIASEIGEIVFTHFGVSGPLVLDMSAKVVSLLESDREVRLLINLKPALKPEQLQKRLLNEFIRKGNLKLENVMKGLLPHRLIDIFIRIASLDPEKKANQVTQAERRSIISLLKAFPLTVIGTLPVEEAMVTGGGISTKEINPRTMESRIIPGLYFAGEMIEGCAQSGGYNLQQAFSTGYLAGEKAASHA